MFLSRSYSISLNFISEIRNELSLLRMLSQLLPKKSLFLNKLWAFWQKRPLNNSLIILCKDCRWLGVVSNTLLSNLASSKIWTSFHISTKRLLFIGLWRCFLYCYRLALWKWDTIESQRDAVYAAVKSLARTFYVWAIYVFIVYI